MEYLERLRHYVWLFVLWFLVVGIGVIGAFWEYYQEKNLPVAVAPAAQTLFLPEPKIPALDSIATAPAYTAQAVWLYDRNSESVLYEDAAQTATSVASLAKLMTALVSYESFSLDDSVRIASASAAIGNRAKFLSTDTFSVYDLLHALLIFSANDAAEALSAAYPGGTAAFVSQMNQRADALDLGHTQFSNPSGLDQTDQFSSAADIGTLADTILEVPLLAQIVSQPVQNIREQKTGRIDTVYTTNALLSKHPRYQGMKTGTTELAGESLVVRIVPTEADIFPIVASSSAQSTASESSAEYDLILVLLGSTSRYADAEQLTHWAISTLRLLNQENF